MQVKLITSVDPKELQNKINDFLERNIKVIDIKYQITSTAFPLFSAMIMYDKF